MSDDDGIKTILPEDLPPERPTIKVTAQIHEAVIAAEAALIAADAPIFERGDVLVIPIAREHSAAHGHTTKTPAFKIVDPDMLRLYLSPVANFRQFKPIQRQPDRWINVAPPKDVAVMLLRRAGDWKFRTIAGVITTPTMRPDGSILYEEGYDAATGLYHRLDPRIDLRSLILDKPSRADAVAALELINDLLIGFPFKTERDRAVALSAIFCGVMIGAMRLRPFHAASSPTSGTGKSYLWDLVAAIAIGDYCPVIAVSRDPIETDKRLDGLLLAGLPVINIDNVEGILGSPTLNQATERPSVRTRKLGGSDLPPIEARSLFLATGNNFRVKSDMARRTLRCLMDARLEAPETRKFATDPFRDVLANRDVYIAAVLTIVRAYRQSGEDVTLRPFQSYGEYTEFVRKPLVWLGCEDPALSTDDVRADDPVREALLAVMANWYAVFGDDPMGVGAVVERTIPREGMIESDVAVVELRDALRAVAGDRNGGVNSVKLGLWLHENMDQPLAGYLLQRMTGRAGAKRWRVVRPDDDGTNRGVT